MLAALCRRREVAEAFESSEEVRRRGGMTSLAEVVGECDEDRERGGEVEGDEEE